MATASVAAFIETLRTHSLLEPSQFQHLAALQQQFRTADALGGELVRRGWLTPWQVSQINRGRGQTLILDQYILLDLLGRGGMGAVFRARQTRMKRLVALKVIRREALSVPGAVERFQREAEAAARLSHPNIVTVFDTNQVGGVHFLVMEYIKGTDLAKLVEEQGPLPIGQACEYIRQAACGLAHAHEKGLVHRDIKPHNLMLTKAGVVKVTDLGLARLNTATGGEASGGLTATGAAMGTPDYTAPEQLRNAKDADIRADIYSLGCSLYHLLIGQVPFPGGSLANKIAGHMFSEPESVQKLRPEIADGLAQIVQRMMAKEPADRYQTAGEVVAALKPFASTGSPSGSGAKAIRTEAPTGAQPANETLPQARQPLASAKLETEIISPASNRPVAGSMTRVGHSGPTGKSKLRLVVPVSVLGLLVMLGVGLALITAVSSLATRQTEVDWGKALEDFDYTELTCGLATDKEDREPLKLAITKLPEAKPVEEHKPLPGKKYTDNSIGMKLVLVNAGKFLMGSPGPDDRLYGPQHEVAITRAFYMGIFEVTQQEYEKVMGENPSSFKSPAGHDTRRFPVEQVSWEDAREFCNQLSALLAEKNSGRVYRLPTEAEWEYACRAGTTTRFHYGNSLSPRQANVHLSDPPDAAEKGPYMDRPTTVGSYNPNDFGLFDMHGNVAEWCADWHGPYTKAALKDPPGPQDGKYRIVRGGPWFLFGHWSRAAVRRMAGPGNRFDGVGFRVVCFSP